MNILQFCKYQNNLHYVDMNYIYRKIRVCFMRYLCGLKFSSVLIFMLFPSVNVVAMLMMAILGVVEDWEGTRGEGQVDRLQH